MAKSTHILERFRKRLILRPLMGGLFLVLFLCSSCRTRIHNTEVSSVRESSSDFVYKGTKFSRHVVMVRGVDLADGPSDFAGPETKAGGPTARHVRWLPFGIPNEKRLQLAENKGGLLSEAASVALDPELLSAHFQKHSSQAQNPVPKQLPLFIRGPVFDKKNSGFDLYFPAGSQALYTVGCLFPEAAGKDPIVNSTLEPAGALFGDMPLALPLSKVKWIWEVMPEFAQVRQSGLLYYADLSVRERSVQKENQKDEFLAEFYFNDVANKPKSPCAVLSGKPAGGSLTGVKLSGPVFVPAGDLRSDIDVVYTPGLGIRKKLSDYTIQNLFPGAIAGLAITSLMMPAHADNFPSWLALSSGLSATLFQYAQIIPKLNSVVTEIKRSADEMKHLEKNTQFDLFKILLRNDQQRINFDESHKLNAVIEVFFSRILGIAQELGEDISLRQLLKYQNETGRNVFGEDVGKVSEFDLELMLMPKDILQALEKQEVGDNGGSRAGQLIARHQKVRDAIEKFTNEHALEFLLISSDALIEIFNHFDFDLGNPEDFVSIVGDSLVTNPENWKFTSDLLQRQNLPAVLRKWSQFSSVSLFKLFEMWKIEASETLDAALPLLVNQISEESSKRSKISKSVDRIDAARRTQFLEEFLGRAIDTRMLPYLNNEKLNPYLMLKNNSQSFAAMNLLAFDLNTLTPGTATEQVFNRLLEVEREQLEEQPLTPEQIVTWIDRCAAASSPALCFGGKAGRPDSMARRIRAIANQLIESHLAYALIQAEDLKAGAVQKSPSARLLLKGKGVALLQHCESLLHGDSFCGLPVLSKFEEIHDRCVVKNLEVSACLGFAQGNPNHALDLERYLSRLEIQLSALKDFGYLRKFDVIWIGRLDSYLKSR